MNFRREKLKNFYLKDTAVENLFLMEYMPEADGDFLKVYLTALMYADYEDMSNRKIANHLHISEEDVLRAWNYWEQMGVIKKHYISPDDRFHYSVEFLNMKEHMLGMDGGTGAETGEMPEGLADRMDDDTVRTVFEQVQEITGRMLGGRETQDIVSWIYDDGIDPALICYAYKYCSERIHNVKFSYVSAVIRSWHEENIFTVADAEKMLAENDQKHNQYYRVMKALGFSRNPTEDEKSKIDSWFENLGFSLDTVLEACRRTSGISNPNINYVNAILKNWSSGKTGGSSGRSGVNGAGRKNAVTEVKQMYERIRRRNTEQYEARRREVYGKVPRIKAIDDALRKTAMAYTKVAIGGGNRSTADSLRHEKTELMNERQKLLNINGYTADYLDMHYDCEKCRDTGILDDGSRCSCFAEKLRKAAGQN